MVATRKLTVVMAVALAAAVTAYLLLGKQTNPADSSSSSKVGRSAKSKDVKFKWTKDRGTRVKEGSVPFAYSLKKNSGKIRLYFCGMGGILSAKSSNGLKFTTEPGSRLMGSNEFGDQPAMVCDASLVPLSNGRVRMYYKGAVGKGGPGEAIHKIFSAVSSNGLDFEKEGLRIDSEKTGDRGWASVPEALRLPDGRVRIYYVSGDFAARGGTMSAISKDGLTFKKESGARVKEFVDPAVTRIRKGLYLMLAAKIGPPPGGPKQSDGLKTGIYSFTSTDGKKFRNRRPVIAGKGIYDPAIAKVGKNKYRVFYGKDLGSLEKPNVVTKSLTGKIKN